MWGVLKGVCLFALGVNVVDPLQCFDMNMKDSTYTGNTKAIFIAGFFFFFGGEVFHQ